MADGPYPSVADIAPLRLYIFFWIASANYSFPDFSKPAVTYCFELVVPAWWAHKLTHGTSWRPFRALDHFLRLFSDGRCPSVGHIAPLGLYIFFWIASRNYPFPDFSKLAVTYCFELVVPALRVQKLSLRICDALSGLTGDFYSFSL